MKSSDLQPNILYENRYCNQNDFSILVCGEKNKYNERVKSIFQMHGSTLNYKKYTYLPEGYYSCKIVVIDSDLFVVGGFSTNGKYNYSVRKFCKNTKTWLYTTKLDLVKKIYCICSFKQNLCFLQ